MLYTKLQRTGQAQHRCIWAQRSLRLTRGDVSDGMGLFSRGSSVLKCRWRSLPFAYSARLVDSILETHHCLNHELGMLWSTCFSAYLSEVQCRRFLLRVTGSLAGLSGAASLAREYGKVSVAISNPIEQQAHTQRWALVLVSQLCQSQTRTIKTTQSSTKAAIFSQLKCPGISKIASYSMAFVKIYRVATIAGCGT
ncbi:hypothetical protein BCR37DRAFT_193586 [Protomyces lactucae-debilis]|uniref:Uncharacterized protein n=1 Tax=Protomyces lactucae-debilis TaxID=2754530 RepID=A0A1Y2EU65_PROLT|nr:uncharacterized protein BCR37DRAFT_193586 [Protomyces lactucae-debilis]ORY75113.1 hypothetical protein BCR37DRAFT_193586 [Protomyces lactucae-debilis]